MRIIGCDFHTRYQQIAMLDTDTGELVERRLQRVGSSHLKSGLELHLNFQVCGVRIPDDPAGGDLLLFFSSILGNAPRREFVIWFLGGRSFSLS